MHPLCCDVLILEGMCGLQFRENVAAWACFYDRKDVFKGFLERVLRLKEVVCRAHVIIAFCVHFYIIVVVCFGLRGIEGVFSVIEDG